MKAYGTFSVLDAKTLKVADLISDRVENSRCEDLLGLFHAKERDAITP